MKESVSSASQFCAFSLCSLWLCGSKRFAFRPPGIRSTSSLGLPGNAKSGTCQGTLAIDAEVGKMLSCRFSFNQFLARRVEEVSWVADGAAADDVRWDARNAACEPRFGIASNLFAAWGLALARPRASANIFKPADTAPEGRSARRERTEKTSRCRQSGRCCACPRWHEPRRAHRSCLRSGAAD
jgi:hypothetical protein